MAVVPVPPTFADGIVSASKLSQLCDAVTFVQNPPLAELRQTSTQSLTTATWTSLTFTTEDVDTEDGHDTSSDTSKYFAVYPGYYQVSGGYVTAGNATGLRGTRFAVNGTAVNASSTMETANASATAYAARTRTVYLDVDDYVEIQAYQSSGGNLSTAATAESQPHLSVRLVHA